MAKRRRRKTAMQQLIADLKQAAGIKPLTPGTLAQFPGRRIGRLKLQNAIKRSF